MRALTLVLALAAACASRPPAPVDGKAAPAAPEIPAVPVVFEGNKNTSARGLTAAARDELKSFQANGRRASDAEDATWAMEQHLRERGYAHGSVDFKVEPERLLFVVNEGPRTLLDAVAFEGVSAFPHKELAAFLSFEGAGALGTGRPLYRQSQVDAAAQEIERFYLQSGYYEARLGTVKTTWNEDKTLATVIVPIREGPLYTIAEVVFEGIEPQAVALVGEPFHVRVPAEAAARVRRTLLDKGRQFATVRGTAEIDRTKHQAVVRIVVEKGPVVRVGAVTFTGAKKTRDRFLRRRLLLEEGDIVAQRVIDEGVGNLYRSGLFRYVRTRKKPSGDDRVDLNIELDEVKARSIDFELGYGSYELVRGSVTYTDRNLFGMGRRLTAKVLGSVRTAGAALRIEDPYLLGERNTLEVGGTFILREEPSFDRRSADFDIVVRRPLDRHHTLRGGYRLRLEEATNVTGELGDAEEEFTRTAGPFLSFQRDTRDSSLLPTRGTNSVVAFFYSTPQLGASLHFLEVHVAVSQHFRLSERAVFAIGVSYRTREILDARGTLPIQERLFNGGDRTVRSFYQDELGPVDVDSGDPIGGLSTGFASFEFRRQVWRAFHIALFYDVGTLSEQAFAVSGKPGQALGLGLRYHLPVGPMRLDIGYNPGERFGADARWAFHLAFGFSF